MTFEELMDLKVGDRIVATGKTWFDTKAGDKGTVVGFSGKDAIIKWDNNVNGWGAIVFMILKMVMENLLEEVHVV